MATYFFLVGVSESVSHWNLQVIATHHSSTTSHIGPGSPYSGEYDTPKGAIANLFDNLKSVLQSHRALRRSPKRVFMRDSHGGFSFPLPADDGENTNDLRRVSTLYNGEKKTRPWRAFSLVHVPKGEIGL